MIDRKVAIYGAVSDGGAPPVITLRAVTVSQDGFVGSNLYLQGSAIFSLNPFAPQFDVDVGTLDMVPVVGFNYLAGPDTGTDDTTIFGRQKYAFDLSIVDPTSATLVAELAGVLSTDAPAADTAASLNVAAVNDNVLVKGFGYTVTAVAAIAAAPILIEVRSDTGGDNTLHYSARVLLPVGSSREVWIPCNFLAPVDVEITASDPGATNFVSVSLETNTGLGNSPT